MPPPPPAKDGDPAAVPAPAPAATTDRTEEKKQDAGQGNANPADDKSRGNGEGHEANAPPAGPAEDLSPEIRQRLRKLEKLEATYPGEFVCYPGLLPTHRLMWP